MKGLFCFVRHRPHSSLIGIDERGANWGDVLWSLSYIDNQSRWAIEWGEGACDELFHITAVLVAAIPADELMRRAKP